MNKNEINQYDYVRIISLHRTFQPEEVIGTRLPAVGDVAAVIEIYENPELGYELESVHEDGNTNWLVTVVSSDVELERIQEPIPPHRNFSAGTTRKPVTYYNTSVDVQIGDYVELKVWLFFWKGWQKGRVHYVPGISPKSDSLEYDGLSWVSIHDENGSPVGVVVNPETGQLKKTVRFIRRTDDSLTETPADYEFPEE